MSTAVLSDFCEIVQGGRLKLTGYHFVDQGFPAYGAGGLNGYLTEYEYDRDGVVLSSIGARCGKCFLAEGKWTSLANTQLILPDPEKADVKFIWFQLNDESRWIRSGSAQPFIKPGDVKNHRVFLPTLAHQKRIAAILEQADSLRRLRQRAIDRLNSLGHAIFSEMFGDPKANLRHWPAITLGEVAEFYSGNSLPEGEEFLGQPDGFLLLKVADPALLRCRNTTMEIRQLVSGHGLALSIKLRKALGSAESTVRESCS